MKTIYANAAKFQCKKLAWMREPEWKWHIVHTDWMRDQMPLSPPQSNLALKLSSKYESTPIGFDVRMNEHNGPNT